MRPGRAIVAKALLALALGLPALPLAAQGTFSLPPGPASPAPRPVGPVDPSDPITTAPRPRPTATATATAAPTPGPTATAPTSPAATSPAPQRAAPPTARPVPRATPGAALTPRPGATTAPAMAPTDALGLPAAPGASPPAGDPFPTALPSTPLAPAALPAASETASPAALPAWWPWAAGALALLAALGALLLWRNRRAQALPQITFERPVVPAPQPAAQPDPAPPPAPAAPARAAPAAAGSTMPPAAITRDGLTLMIEARRLDASLVATTLAYRLRLSNEGPTTLSALAIEGDMIAAHASLPVEQQIASARQQLELRHAVVELAPGETSELRGEFRLPLTAITPIRAGNAAFFVPLARLRVQAAKSADESLVLVETFVIGELPDQPGGALRPFRLDLGPRTYGRIGLRAVG